jgi:hypothetical protein
MPKRRLTDELGALSKRALVAKVDSNQTKVPKFYQVSIIYKKLYPRRNFIDKPFYVGIQYVSPEIFLTELDAEKFVPYFVKRLISEEKIGTEVIQSDNSLDLNLVTPGIAPLMVSMIESNEEYDEKMRNE